MSRLYSSVLADHQLRWRALDKAHRDCHKATKKPDLGLRKQERALRGPFEAEVKTYNSGRVSGFVVGAFGAVSMQVRNLADLIACGDGAEYPALFGPAKN